MESGGRGTAGLAGGKAARQQGSHSFLVRFIPSITNKSSTYRSEHDSENQPPIAPQDDPGRGGPPGQWRQSPERAQENPQEARLQKLGLPS